MKKLIVYALVLAIFTALPGCSQGIAAVDENKIEVVTTMFPAYDFVREIAGDAVNLSLLVPPGAETHSFEPSPQNMIEIAECDLLIYNGGESESWVGELVSAGAECELLSMLECVRLLEEEHKEGMQSAKHSHEHEAEHEHEYDEHVWTSPVNSILICENICAALCSADPENAQIYEAGLERFAGELTALDARFRSICENADGDTLIFADRFPVRYFVEEYGLDYYAAFPGCAEDTEPSAKTVAFLIDRVREDSISAVLYIEFSNEKMADIVCEDTGCKKLRFHSCHNVSADEFESGVTYLKLMYANAESLEEALN